MQTIILAGNLGSGKSSAAEYLQKKYGFKQIAFANKLKELAKSLFEFSDETLYGPSEMRNKKDLRVNTPQFWDHAQNWVCGTECRRMMEDLFKGTRVPVATAIDALQEQVDEFQLNREDLTPRYILQYLGTEWGRALHENLWIHAVKKHIEQHPDNWVITDCRFENEASVLKKGNDTTQLVWIDAQKRVPLPEALNHASEPKIEDFWHLEPLLIDNNTTIEALYEQLDRIVTP